MEDTPHPEILPGEIEASAESHSLAFALEKLKEARRNEPEEEPNDG